MSRTQRAERPRRTGHPAQRPTINIQVCPWRGRGTPRSRDGTSKVVADRGMKRCRRGGMKPPRTRNRTPTQRADLLGRRPAPRNLSNPLGDADFHSPYARKSYKRRAARQITFAKSPLMPQRPHVEEWHLERCCRREKHMTDTAKGSDPRKPARDCTS
ncbi:hypothetical protein K523DRAFT_130890 [Schizophyllum commune Tattone D]|nr:hypothetical protein K523DRAFT_130890 [Schizophyllum commune Tattone D]